MNKNDKENALDYLGVIRGGPDRKSEIQNH